MEMIKLGVLDKNRLFASSKSFMLFLVFFKNYIHTSFILTFENILSSFFFI